MGFWQSYNKADKTLAVATVFFVFSLWLHLEYPHSLFVRGFQFCCEAALIGGVADWFAVTALFRKPLGFPYHTAILPRKRDVFVAACVTMVQGEFFSKKKIFQRIKHLKFLTLFLEWLNKREQQEMMLRWLIHYSRRKLQMVDPIILADDFRHKLSKIPQNKLFANIGEWICQEKEQNLVISSIAFLEKKLNTPEALRMIEKLLEDYSQQKTADTVKTFFASIAQAMNIVNYTEAAELLQKQLLALLTEMRQEDSLTRQMILRTLHGAIQKTVQGDEFQKFFVSWRAEVLADLPLEIKLKEAAAALRRQLLNHSAEEPDEASLEKILRRVFLLEIQGCCKALQTDERLQKMMDRFLYDLAGRTVLQAQTMVGIIVREVLSGMTDEQMNHLVYDKVEPDLLWIRMNGSIVGAGIGLCLFVLLQLF